MKPLLVSMILSAMFLSAGAIAGANHTRGLPARTSLAMPGNVTVVSKNQSWPLPGRISVEPCSRRRCIGV